MKNQRIIDNPLNPSLLCGSITCLIVCDGELNKKLLDKFIKLKPPQKPEIIAADGASNFLYRHKITPGYIIGDLDAIRPEVLGFYKRKGVKIKKISDQYKNDLEKALKLALSRKIKNIFIIGATGKRPDHNLNNLSIIKRFSRKANIKLYDKTFEMFYIKKKCEFEYKRGEVVSLIPMPKASGIKTSGLKWQLNNATLEFGIREGALNLASDNHVTIDVHTGDLLVFKKHFGKINI